jgi:hypothetical protein
MDMAKLDSDEKLAGGAAAVVVVAGLVATLSWGTYAVSWLGILGALAVLGIILAPQMAPQTQLPGTRGSLLVAAAGLAAVFMVLAFLVNVSFVFFRFGIADLLFIVAVIASVVMAWIARRIFQAEGGKFVIGSSTKTDVSAGASPPAAAPPPATPPPADTRPDDEVESRP